MSTKLNNAIVQTGEKESKVPLFVIGQNGRECYDPGRKEPGEAGQDAQNMPLKADLMV